MANLKRSKSMDFSMPTRSTGFTLPLHFGHTSAKLKTFKSCPNIHTDIRVDSEGYEWTTLIPSMIDSWVKIKNAENLVDSTVSYFKSRANCIRTTPFRTTTSVLAKMPVKKIIEDETPSNAFVNINNAKHVTNLLVSAVKLKSEQILSIILYDFIRNNQLQESCLEHLHTYPSQQIDVMTESYNCLSDKLLFSMDKLRKLKLEVDDEKLRQKLLREQLDFSESLYNDMLLENYTLFQEIRDFENQNSNTIFNEHGIQKIINDTAAFQSEFKHELQNYRLVHDSIMKSQEIINNMTTIESSLAEERANIMKDIQEIEKTIQTKQQKSIKAILINQLIMLLENIVPFKI